MSKACGAIQIDKTPNFLCIHAPYQHDFYTLQSIGSTFCVIAFYYVTYKMIQLKYLLIKQISIRYLTLFSISCS